MSAGVVHLDDDDAARRAASYLYTKGSKNLKTEYESDAWLIDKDGREQGIEDPKCLKYLMSAARYLLTTPAPANSIYDPLRKDRERVEVAVTRQRVTQNGAR